MCRLYLLDCNTTVQLSFSCFMGVFSKDLTSVPIIRYVFCLIFSIMHNTPFELHIPVWVSGDYGHVLFSLCDLLQFECFIKIIGLKTCLVSYFLQHNVRAWWFTWLKLFAEFVLKKSTFSVYFFLFFDRNT